MQFQRAQSSGYQRQQIVQGGIVCDLAVRLPQVCEQGGQVAVAEQGDAFRELQQQIAFFVKYGAPDLGNRLAGMGF